MRTAVTALAGALAACGGPGLRGAIAVEPGKEPQPTHERAILVPAECHDRTGAKARVASEFWVVRTDARELLVEARRGYASIIVTNRLALPTAETVFQFVSDDGDGPALLHEIRLPSEEGGRATLTVTDAFDERLVGGRVLAVPGPALVSCRLDTRQALE